MLAGWLRSSVGASRDLFAQVVAHLADLCPPPSLHLLAGLLRQAQATGDDALAVGALALVARMQQGPEGQEVMRGPSHVSACAPGWKWVCCPTEAPADSATFHGCVSFGTDQKCWCSLQHLIHVDLCAVQHAFTPGLHFSPLLPPFLPFLPLDLPSQVTRVLAEGGWLDTTHRLLLQHRTQALQGEPLALSSLSLTLTTLQHMAALAAAQLAGEGWAASAQLEGGGQVMGRVAAQVSALAAKCLVPAANVGVLVGHAAGCAVLVRTLNLAALLAASVSSRAGKEGWRHAAAMLLSCCCHTPPAHDFHLVAWFILVAPSKMNQLSLGQCL